MLGTWGRSLNYLLALCLCTTSFTALRMRGSFGWGEASLLLWFCAALVGVCLARRIHRFVLAHALFFLSSNLLLLAGLTAGWDIAGSTRLHGLAALDFGMTGPLLLLALPGPEVRLKHFGGAWAKLGGSFFCLLWLAGWCSPALAARFTYEQSRFCGLSANPNQTALFLILLPLLFSRLQVRLWLKLLVVSLLTWIGFSTGSDALILAWVCMACAFIFRAILTRSSKKLHLSMLVPMLWVALSWIGLHHGKQSATDFTRLETAQENVGTRWGLVVHGLQAWKTSPLVGLGPGAFSGESGPFDVFEAHNTLVDWLTNAGLLGLLGYLALLFGLVRRGASLPMLVAVLTFSLFHYTFRHPIFWFSLYLCAIDQRQTGEESPD